MLWFDQNLKVASAYVQCNTTIKAEYEYVGHNILGNRGNVCDQAIHSDYKCISPPGYESDDTLKAVKKSKYDDADDMTSLEPETINPMLVLDGNGQIEQV